MNLSVLNKMTPNFIDIVLLLLVGVSVYFKNHLITSYVILAIPCLFMTFMVFRQAIDCYTQKSIYNFTMLVTAMEIKVDYSTRIVRDIIIYGLHIYLYTLNPKAIYLTSIVLCLTYDLMIYNAAFNPLMKKYVINKTMDIVEEHQNKQK